MAAVLGKHWVITQQEVLCCWRHFLVAEANLPVEVPARMQNWRCDSPSQETCGCWGDGWSQTKQVSILELCAVLPRASYTPELSLFPWSGTRSDTSLWRCLGFALSFAERSTSRVWRLVQERKMVGIAVKEGTWWHVPHHLALDFIPNLHLKLQKRQNKLTRATSFHGNLWEPPLSQNDCQDYQESE